VKALIFCSILIVGLASSMLLAQQLSDAEVLAAIKIGETGKPAQLVSSCAAAAGKVLPGAPRKGIGAFDVTVANNIGRIAMLAANGKRLYKPLALDTVPDELRSPSIVVTVDPYDPSAAFIEHVVLKSKEQPDVVLQPVNIEKEPVEWSNMLGGKAERNRAIATFDPARVKDLPAGDVDVVVVTPKGERRCKIGEKDRAMLFAGRVK
jgi:hypothetical protein